MKKIFTYLSMFLMLLFGVVCLTACGGDDDNDSDEGKGTSQNEGKVDPNKDTTAPWGYYATIYHIDNKTVYGNVDYELYLQIRDANARGDVAAFTSYAFLKEYEGYEHYMGYYLYVKNNKKYLIPLWNNVNRDKTENTYDSRTYQYSGGSVTFYLNISSVDDDDLIPYSNLKKVSYKDNVLTIDGSEYQKVNFTQHIQWIDEWCSEMIDKLEES